MNIAILQQNYTIGDFSGNARKIVEGYHKAVSSNADIVLTGELALFGYPPLDMLERSDHIAAQYAALDSVRAHIKETPLILGFAERNESEGKPLYNSALVLQNGSVVACARKILLPTYDVFDESRYFEPNPEPPLIWEHGGKRIGILLCEDIWNGSEYNGSRVLYRRDPVAELSDMRIDALLVLNGSPYYWGKGDTRLRLARAIAKKLHAPVAYANQIGGNTDLVFDGRSFVIGASGACVAAAPAFSEKLLMADTEAPEAAYPHDTNNIADIYDALVLSVRDYMAKTGNTHAVIGLSGGIDSAVTAAIAVSALGKDNVRGITMPSRFSSEGSVSDAAALAKNLGISFTAISIRDIYQTFGDELAPIINWESPMEVTEENVQARIRGALLMAISNREGSIVLTTGNKSEIAVGYCTLYGDMVGGYGILSDVPKTLVYALARHINDIGETEVIPKNTIEKPPSAELRPDQKDEDSLPPYDILDAVLHQYIEEKKSAEDIVASGYDGDTVAWIIHAVHRNEYKRRQMAPGPKVTSKAFGTGRRWPIAARLSKPL